MIKSTLKRLFGSEAEPEAAAAELSVVIAPDPIGDRVHHEYFVFEQRPEDGKFPWLCRVYAQNSACTEREGLADTADSARNAALSFAAITKAGLRGAA